MQSETPKLYQPSKAHREPCTNRTLFTPLLRGERCKSAETALTKCSSTPKDTTRVQTCLLRVFFAFGDVTCRSLRNVPFVDMALGQKFYHDALSMYGPSQSPHQRSRGILTDNGKRKTVPPKVHELFKSSFYRFARCAGLC